MKKVKISYKDNFTKIVFDYNPRIVKIVGSIPGSYFNKEGGAWFLPKEQTRNLCREFRKEEVYMLLSKEIQVEFGVNKYGFSKKEIEKKRNYMLNHPSAQTDAPDFDVSVLNLNEGLNPFPFQKAGIKYGIEKNGRVLIGDEMGLGKTIQAICIARYYQKNWPLLIVAPSSLLYNWKKEILTWLKGINEEDIKIMNKSSDVPSSIITISSYDYAYKNQDSLVEYLGLSGVLIVDESQNIMSNDSLRTKSIMHLSSLSKRVILISGTPFLNKPLELFTQLYCLDPVNFDDYYKFVYRYCDAFKTKIKNKTILNVSGASNLEELNNLLIDNYMVRRRKSQVLSQLPPKKRFTKYIQEPDTNINSEYTDNLRNICFNALANNNYNIQDAKLDIMENNKMEFKNSTFEAYNETAERKSEEISKMVSEYFTERSENSEPLIVFAYHDSVISAIEKRIKIEHPKMKYIKIDGKVDKEKRFEMVEEFQNNKEYGLAILSIKAASVGLTLTRSSTVWMTEIPWTSGLALQAEDRAHRISQTKDVYIYYLIMENTLDIVLWNLIVNKSDMLNKVLDGGLNNEIEESNEEEMSELEEADLVTTMLIQCKKEKEVVLN